MTVQIVVLFARALLSGHWSAAPRFYSFFPHQKRKAV
jgi:hypothetical protein